MNADSGVFTAPATGAYYFTFSAVAGSPETRVQLELNGANVGSAFGSEKYDAMALVRIINVHKGDAVSLDLLLGGSLLVDYGATFTGRLLPSNSIYFDVGRSSDFFNPLTIIDEDIVEEATDDNEETGTEEVTNEVSEGDGEDYSTDIMNNNAEIIPFHPSKLSLLSVDGGMDAGEGIFTAPVDGAYHFAFSGLSDGNGNIQLGLVVNDIIVASAYGDDDKKAAVSLATILKLKKGDRVSVQLNYGFLVDDVINSFTHFIGYRIEDKDPCASPEGVYFDIGRQTNLNNNISIHDETLLLEYDPKEVLAVGPGLDVDSGVFTVPFDGTYQFTFSGNVDEGNTQVELTINGQRIGSSYGSDDDTLWISNLIDVKMGDKVAIRLAGALYESNYSYTHFTGQLVAAKC